MVGCNVFLGGSAALKYGKMSKISGNDGTLMSAKVSVSVSDASTTSSCLFALFVVFDLFLNLHLLFLHILDYQVSVYYCLLPPPDFTPGCTADQVSCLLIIYFSKFL